MGGAGGDPNPVKVETLATVDCNETSITVSHGDGFVYYVCKAPKNQFSTDLVWTLQRVANGAAMPETLVSSDHPLELMTKDDSAYYVYEATDFDTSGNTWGNNIKRLPVGSQTLAPFATARNVNWRPLLLLESADGMYLADQWDSGIAWLTLYSKPSGAYNVITMKAAATIVASWVDAGGFGWISRPFDGKAPAAYQGMGTKITDLPNLCVRFFRDTTSPGWLGFCGTGSKLDIARISETGNPTVVAPAVVDPSQYYWRAFNTDRLYWFEGSSSAATSLRWLDGTGQTATLRLPIGVYPLDVSGDYAYFSAGKVVYRAALSQATSP
jgi:hypothetical protein